MIKNNLPKETGPEEIVYKGDLFEVVHQPMQAGKYKFVLEIAKRPPGTRLIIVSPDKKILITREYRPEHKSWDFRLPGGKVVDSLDEYNRLVKQGKDLVKMAAEGAKKEAVEEVGIVVDKLKLFNLSHCGVTIIWDLYYFLVTKYHPHPEGQHLEADENIELLWFSFAEAKKICLSNKMREDRSAAILLRYLESVKA
ncbi:MAG: NUDIX hydrolase [Candidatus Daviesbacteria bacterium]|nr:NUDIX hydrolase [Candidatus Daviesbacteria bacterium]